jgi:hypothetical protein
VRYFVAVLAGLAFVVWGGSALNWGEWVLVAVAVVVAVGWFWWEVRRAPYGYEDRGGYHDGRPDEELAEVFEWPDRPDTSTVRHGGLGR